MSQQNTIMQPPRSAHQLVSDLVECVEVAVETLNGLRAILASVRRDEQCTSRIKYICSIGLGQAEYISGNLEEDAKKADAELFALERVATQIDQLENVSQHEGGAA